MRFAYADPPYPGLAGYYPERAEVDHASLIDRLTGDFPDGWALSTSSRAMRDVLLLCPADVRVCAWFKNQRPVKSRHAVTSWEPLIVWHGRPLSTAVAQGVHDGLIAQGRFRAFPGAMLGMKPPAFAEWMFRQLGAAPGDQLVDLYPGSGAIGRAWVRFSGAGQLRLLGEATTPAMGDASVLATGDASPDATAVRDASSRTSATTLYKVVTA